MIRIELKIFNLKLSIPKNKKSEFFTKLMVNSLVEKGRKHIRA